MIPEIEVKFRKSYILLLAVGMTIVTLFFIHKEMFNWRDFDITVILKIFFLGSLSITIWVWIRFFGNKPEFKITNEGIWYRKHFFSRKITEFASWNNIEYFFVEAVTQKGITTEELKIKVKEKKKYLKLTLNGINISKEEVIQIVSEKGKEHNFHDLGFEANTYSKY